MYKYRFEISKFNNPKKDGLSFIGKDWYEFEAKDDNEASFKMKYEELDRNGYFINRNFYSLQRLYTTEEIQIEFGIEMNKEIENWINIKIY